MRQNIKRKRLDVEVFEKSQQLGGLIACEVHNGNLFIRLGDMFLIPKKES